MLRVFALQKLGSERRERTLGYEAPAKQSTGANEVSEADERLAKCGTADPTFAAESDSFCGE